MTYNTYINEFIYQGDNLQYINFEEGRIRVMQAVTQNNGYDLLAIDGNMDLPGGKRGAYDFFIRDYQGNVRMIVTEATHLGSNSCTMETGRAANEEPLFGQVDANGTPSADNEVKARFATSSIPGQEGGNGWQNSAIQNYVSRVGNLTGKKVGPNTLLKVMAGDEVSATTIYYYKDAVVNQSGGASVLPNLLGSLMQALSGSAVTSGLTKNAAANITSQLNSSLPFGEITDPDVANASGNNPRAYLSVMFFDERFNFVSEGSTALRVTQSGNGAPALVLANIKSPKNGYAYVYVSNTSDEMVYFDNLQVANNRGRIIEENHYYAYGLKIASISSRKLADVSEGTVKNNYGYQGDYSEFDEDIGWNDFQLRNYDPQIGRWIQQDPYQEFASPYIGMADDPANYVDPSGGNVLSGLNAVEKGAVKVLGGAILGLGVDLLSGGDGWKGAVAGAAIGLGASMLNLFTATSVVVQSLNAANYTSTVSLQVGFVVQYTSSNGGFDLNWKALYKEDLKAIYRERNAREGTENELGTYFEDRLEEVFERNGGQMTRNGELLTDGNNRNTKPDFTGPATYWDLGKMRTSMVPGAAAVESKQSKRRGLYLSSNDGQIKGHIDNLRAKFAPEYRHPGFSASIMLVTTADVKPSPSMKSYAKDRQINFRHVHAEYTFERLENGRKVWHFRFIKTAR